MQNAIEALPFWISAPTVKPLIRTMMEASRHEYLDSGEHFAVFAAFKELRPMVTGAVAVTLADYLDNAERHSATGRRGI